MDSGAEVESISPAELDRELHKLTPLIRAEFDTPNGRKQFEQTLLDKHRLVAEARRRGFERDATVRLQVDELESKLIVQKLLAQEEATAGVLGEADAKAYYQTHLTEFEIAPRRHLARIWFQANSADERKKARTKAAGVLTKAKAGQDFGKLAALGTGLERLQAGDLGWVMPGDLKDISQERAVAALKAPGDLTGVLEGSDGVGFLKLVAIQPARQPAFEEVKSRVENRLMPIRQRQVYEQLLVRLRGQNSNGADGSLAR